MGLRRLRKRQGEARMRATVRGDRCFAYIIVMLLILLFVLTWWTLAIPARLLMLVDEADIPDETKTYIYMGIGILPLAIVVASIIMH